MRKIVYVFVKSEAGEFFVDVTQFSSNHVVTLVDKATIF